MQYQWRCSGTYWLLADSSLTETPAAKAADKEGIGSGEQHAWLPEHKADAREGGGGGGKELADGEGGDEAGVLCALPDSYINKKISCGWQIHTGQFVNGEGECINCIQDLLKERDNVVIILVPWGIHRVRVLKGEPLNNTYKSSNRLGFDPVVTTSGFDWSSPNVLEQRLVIMLLIYQLLLRGYLDGSAQLGGGEQDTFWHDNVGIIWYLGGPSRSSFEGWTTMLLNGQSD